VILVIIVTSKPAESWKNEYITGVESNLSNITKKFSSWKPDKKRWLPVGGRVLSYAQLQLIV